MKSRAPLGACLAVAAASLVLLLRWPIVALDEDLWYHLAAGRWIVAHRAIPTESFFSFISPPAPWKDYYWLFQVLVYAVHSVSGYAGLIVLRTAVFALLLLFVGLLLLDDRGPWRCAVFGLAALCLPQRFLFVRPHLFTYLFIAASLFILERRPRWAFALPVLSVLWGNLHGISYPIPLLIFGAYALGADRRLRLWLAVSAFCLFLTPLGTGLLEVPFRPLTYSEGRVLEFKPTTLRDLAFFSLSGWEGATSSAFTVLLLLTCASLRKARARDLVLFLGAAVLLKQRVRFFTEFTLLCLPILRRAAPAPRAALAAACLLPLFAFRNAFSTGLDYPLSLRRLPVGIADYLRERGSGGTILNAPSLGGYLQWELYPRYRVAFDMEVVQWGDEGYRIADNWFKDPELFARLISQYHPDYLAVPVSAGGFEPPHYRVVAKDETGVLYAR